MRLFKKNGSILPQNQISIIIGDVRVFFPSEEELLADGWVEYTPEQVVTSKEELYKQRIVELIRERYSVDDELAILRQRDVKIDDFNAYNTYVEDCKAQAREEIYGDE